MTDTKQDAERQQELIRRWQDHDEFLTGSEMAELLNALVDERQARAAQELRPAGGELREAFEAKARERAGFAEHDLHQTLPGIYDGMLVRAAWEGCIFGVAFAASERPRPSDELTYAVGKLLESEGEDFRLKHPELLDAYHAVSERGHSAPESGKEGCTCQKCGFVFKVDFLVADELWAEIADGKNLLCGECIVEALENKGYGAYRMTDIVPLSGRGK